MISGRTTGERLMRAELLLVISIRVTYAALCSGYGTARVLPVQQPREIRRSIKLAEEEVLSDYLADPFAYVVGKDDAGQEEKEPNSDPHPPVCLDGMGEILFVECGFGCDQHGQDATKAVVRACRNAIEFNSIPSIRKIVPGGYDAMKLHVQIGVPVAAGQIDLAQVAAVFPYGTLLPPVIERGGLLARSGIVLPEMGDASDEMVIAVACVTVGY